jgi:hypothetical protein
LQERKPERGDSLAGKIHVGNMGFSDGRNLDSELFDLDSAAEDLDSRLANIGIFFTIRCVLSLSLVKLKDTEYTAQKANGAGSPFPSQPSVWLLSHSEQ